MKKTLALAAALFLPAAASAQDWQPEWYIQVRWTSDVGGIVYDGKVYYKGPMSGLPAVGTTNYHNFVSQVRFKDAMGNEGPPVRVYLTGTVTGAVLR